MLPLGVPTITLEVHTTAHVQMKTLGARKFAECAQGSPAREDTELTQGKTLSSSSRTQPPGCSSFFIYLPHLSPPF